jgi:two-component system, chemotaxis family, protein-glutamate methylesterase/glutaminase
MGDTLRLFIVDDSALIRRMLRGIFASDPTIEVVGEAANGRDALRLVAELRPDIITMDVRMPLMDGVETTEHLMAYHPTPILVLTASLSRYDIDITFRMLGAGALDVMEKPSLANQSDVDLARRELIRRVKTLARVKVVTHLRGRRRLAAVAAADVPAGKPLPAPAPLPVPSRPKKPATRPLAAHDTAYPIIVIGASTGGPRVVRQILAGLPADFGAAMLVVQHIAEGFASGMVEWLAAGIALPIALAESGDLLDAGRILVAPERSNLMLDAYGRVHLSTKPILLQLPSIDVTMQAVAEYYGTRAVGVLLTGMGRDGAIGMKSIRRVGGFTIAQDQASSTIFGMPRAAIELGAAAAVLAPEDIVATLLRYTGRQSAAQPWAGRRDMPLL